MKAYHFAMVPERKGTFGTIVKIALVAGGVYLGYKYWEKKKDEEDFDINARAQTVEANMEYDSEVHEAEDFAARVKEAAKRVKNLL